MPQNARRRIQGSRHPLSRANLISEALRQARLDLDAQLKVSKKPTGDANPERRAMRGMKAAKALADLDNGKLSRVVAYLRDEKNYVTTQIREAAMNSVRDGHPSADLSKLEAREKKLAALIETLSGKLNIRLTQA